MFAQRYNRHYKRKGHVWYDRFHSRIIHGKKQFFRVFNYIAKNPIKSKICASVFDYTYGGCMHLSRRWYSIVEPPDEIVTTCLQMLRLHPT